MDSHRDEDTYRTAALLVKGSCLLQEKTTMTMGKRSLRSGSQSTAIHLGWTRTQMMTAWIGMNGSEVRVFEGGVDWDGACLAMKTITGRRR